MTDAWCRASHNELILDAGAVGADAAGTIEAVVVTNGVARATAPMLAATGRISSKYGLTTAWCRWWRTKSLQRSGAAPFEDVT